MHIDNESDTTLEDLRGDLAHRYKWQPSGGGSVDDAIVEADLAALERDGYVIWENLLSIEQCRQIRAVVRPWLAHTGRNSFEGRRTQRIYSVLSRTRVCDRLVDNPRVLAVLDRLLMPNRSEAFALFPCTFFNVCIIDSRSISGNDVPALNLISSPGKLP